MGVGVGLAGLLFLVGVATGQPGERRGLIAVVKPPGAGYAVGIELVAHPCTAGPRAGAGPGPCRR
jgi:hypothetical protein